MEKTFGFTVVLVSFVTLTVAFIPFLPTPEPGEDLFVDCSQPTHHKKFCNTDSICAWNMCECPGRNGCRLVCTSNMGQWCNGLHENEYSHASVTPFGKHQVWMLYGSYCSVEVKP